MGGFNYTFKVPEISRFYGIVVAIFYDDHNPPHFHVRYGEHKASIHIVDLAILDGSLPGRALGLVMEWAALHKKELQDDWERARRMEPLVPIDPLK